MATLQQGQGIDLPWRCSRDDRHDEWSSNYSLPFGGKEVQSPYWTIVQQKDVFYRDTPETIDAA